MSEWRTVQLTDALEFREGPGILAKDFHESGVPLVRLAGLKRGASLLTDCNFLDPDRVAKKWAHFRTQEGDVLLSTSASLGEVAVVDKTSAGAIPYTGIIAFRPLNEGIDQTFIPFMLTAPTFKAQIEAMGVGSVMKHFGPMHLRQMTVSIPDVRTQRVIAEVLGALDDKIAANTKLASTANDLIRTGFQSLGQSSTDTLPIGQLVSHRRDSVDPRIVDGETAYVGLEHFSRRHMWLTISSSAAEVTSAKLAFKAGDILFGKLRPYFHKVATAPADGICSTDILVLAPSRQSLAGFALAAVADDLVIASVSASSEGTRMPRTKWSDLASVEVPWPGEAAASRFSAEVMTLRDRVLSALDENLSLDALRDVLLPQLMSGKLRVKDAEKVVEEVV